MTNTRMKDFFDLWVAAARHHAGDAVLKRAIEATFARRQTGIPGARPIGLSDAFAEDTTKQVQWRAFLKKNRLDAMDLGEVVRYVRERARRFGFTSP